MDKLKAILAVANGAVLLGLLIVVGFLMGNPNNPFIGFAIPVIILAIEFLILKLAGKKMPYLFYTLSYIFFIIFLVIAALLSTR